MAPLCFMYTSVLTCATHMFLQHTVHPYIDISWMFSWPGLPGCCVLPGFSICSLAAGRKFLNVSNSVLRRVCIYRNIVEPLLNSCPCLYILCTGRWLADGLKERIISWRYPVRPLAINLAYTVGDHLTNGPT